MDTRFEGNGEDVVVVLAIVIDQKRFSELKLLLIINVFIFNQVMHICNEIPIDIYFDFIYLTTVVWSRLAHPLGNTQKVR